MSELKLSDIWDDATNAVCQIMQESKMCNCPNGECIASTVEPSKETLAQWNTRAVPDVPELVRYRIWFDNNYNEIVDEDPEGEYVRYHQAAAVIAAKDGRITDYKNLVDALHAKLAQYEAQEPVAWMHPEAGWTDVCKVTVANHCKHGIEPLPLYASPAPAADLKAENERLREALTVASKYRMTRDELIEKVATLLS